MPNRADGEQPESEPKKLVDDVKPGTAEATADVLRDLITNLGTLRTAGQKSNTAFIAYMDRVILLSGGTLTLIFTVLGSVSAHLYETHLQVRHIPFILVACWLLVVAITTGLLYNSASIKLGHYQDAESALTIVDAQVKLKLLSLPQVTDVSKVNAIPSLLGAASLQNNIKYCRRGARIFGWLAQCALVSAFFFLVLFIQTNISIMLAAAPHK